MLRYFFIFFFFSSAQCSFTVVRSYAEEKARIQIIHNSPDTSLNKIDLYLNDNKILSGLSFREATPFFTVESDSVLKLQIARSPSNSVAETLRTFSIHVESGKSSSILLQGVEDTIHYEPNPSGKSIALSALVLENIKQTYEGKSEIPVRIANGCTDMPEVNLVAKDVAPLLSNMTFGSITPLDIVMPTTNYNFLLLTPSNQIILREIPVNLTGLGEQSIVVFFSGFYNSTNNNNGQNLGIFGARPNGTIIDFQKITSFTESKECESNYTFLKTSSSISIGSNNPFGEDICMFDSMGRLVNSTKHNDEQTFISMVNIGKGIYFIVVNARKPEQEIYPMIIGE
ncbi:MAG: DUF4397 domain-containing protein [Ignavibacteriae bacterium]|nr:DUF4397 domain-containing protein [Ignavibacteriota bacterium]